MSSDIAIKVENLSKCYQIYDTPRDRLKQFVYPKIKSLLAPIARLLGSHSPLATRLLPRNYYKEFWALKDVSFEVKKGETVGIIGRNGSGKSTLLQMICGTLTPTSGSIQTNGRVAALLELGAGFNPEFTGRENVYMNASILGLTQDEIDARFDEIAAFADIGDFIEQPVKTYSSGMYVRLAFAVAVNVDADILVIDEALSVGDAFFTQKCMRFLRKFRETGTLLFVSHDASAVISLCNQAIWLDNNRLRQLGRPKDISEEYTAYIYESQQGKSTVKQINPLNTNSDNDEIAIARDARIEFINCTKFRNDIQLFSFKEDASSFGKMGASIQNVHLLDTSERILSWIVGGEKVILEVNCHAYQDIYSPIIGFFVKDRLGQVLFGDNTYLSYINSPISVKKDSSFKARFKFKIPILPLGDYSINVALAEGTQEEHVQHQWIHEAMVFKSTSTSITTGLVGIPIDNIELLIADKIDWKIKK